MIFWLPQQNYVLEQRPTDSSPLADRLSPTASASELTTNLLGVPPTIDEKKMSRPLQWQCGFSPRPLGGSLSTETARASCGPSAHDHGRTAR